MVINGLLADHCFNTNTNLPCKNSTITVKRICAGMFLHGNVFSIKTEFCLL